MDLMSTAAGLAKRAIRVNERVARAAVSRFREIAAHVEIVHADADSLTATDLSTPVRPSAALNRRLADIARLRQDILSQGALPLWEGYADIEGYPKSIGKGASRSPRDVSTSHHVGRLFAYLVELHRPSLVVEVGTAFGVSGLYWLAGLETVGAGQLLTFDPNTEWAAIARKNLSAVGNRFTQVNKTFEDGAAERGERRVDMAFIDAIHTGAFVRSQLEVIESHASTGAIVVFDDINFSPDMQECWRSLSTDRRYAAAFSYAGQIGAVELR